jgi:hypothetical protein
VEAKGSGCPLVAEKPPERLGERKRVAPTVDDRYLGGVPIVSSRSIDGEEFFAHNRSTPADQLCAFGREIFRDEPGP